MKTITKPFLMVLMTFLITTALIAQNKHEVSVDAGQQVVIQKLLGKIIIKDHSGSNLLIEASDLPALPEKAKGLKEVYGGGMDNSGIGLNIQESGKLIIVSGATKRSEEATYVFHVPASVNMKVDYSSPFGYDEIEVNGFSNELEVTTLNEGIALENVTGPMTIHTINGDINLDFTTLNQQSPSSISSINGEMEVKLPASTPVDLKFSCMHGEIYTDLDIELEKKDEPKKGEWVNIGGNSNSKGTMNGGGVELTLSTINGSIYLRKK